MSSNYDDSSDFYEMEIQERDWEIIRLTEEKRKLEERVNDLETAIRSHKDNYGDDLCWLNDKKLWILLPEYKEEDLLNISNSLPQKDEFLSNCSRYHESRREGIKYIAIQKKE